MELVPGQSTGEQAEAHEESDQVLLVIQGAIEGEVDGTGISLKEDEFILIRAGVKHRFVNHAKDKAVTFNVYAAPAYPADTKG